MGMIVPSLAHWLEASELLNGKGMFMTGTDTDVGKTWVGKQLIHTLRVLGREVIPRKPVECRCSANRCVATRECGRVGTR